MSSYNTNILAILHAAALACGLAPADITGRSQRQEAADARNIAAHCLRQAGYLLSAIGLALGRHHFQAAQGIYEESRKSTGLLF